MRYTLVLGLAILVAHDVAGEDKPIPQDKSQMEERYRQRLEWNRRTVQGAYDKVGKKDPRWDKSAREAMDLAARAYSQQVDPIITYDEVYNSSKAAIDAGCDDPFIGYMFNRNSVGPNFPGEAEAIRRMQSSAKALASSRYPAFRRAGVLEKAGTFTVTVKDLGDEAREEGKHDFEAALALLPESVASDERNKFWEDRWFETLWDILRGYRQIGMGAPDAYQKVDARLAKLPEMKVLRLQLRGHFWNMYGWEARSTAFAPEVPEKAFETFHRRLLDAQKAYREAWEARPNDARTADGLLSIEKSIGGDRATMELWFERAMQADGSMVSSCLTKLDWLDPKWHGSLEEMLAFGHACAETKNWRDGITLLAGDAHRRYCSLISQRDAYQYLRKPEVWSEIQAVYDEFFKHYPDNAVARSKYASICTLGGYYAEAHAQFVILGDRLTSWPDFPFFPLPTLKEMRDIVDKAFASEVRHRNSPDPNKRDDKEKPK